MSDGFVKIYAAMIDSSVWGEAHPTRIVWVTMLAMANADGIVSASVGGLARRAVVSREECEAALAVFLGPDPDSRDGTTGERISKVDGGWLILNHRKYRERRSPKQIATAARVAKHRAGKPSGVTERDNPSPVTPRYVTPSNAQRQRTEAEVKAEAPSDRSPDPTRAQAEPPPGDPGLEQRDGMFWPLARGYAERYEAATGSPWMSHTANEREIATVARWLDASGTDLDAFLGAWFADPWAKSHRWPWKHAAKNPERFLAPKPAEPASLVDASAERRDSLRRTREAAEAAARALASGPDPSAYPEEHAALQATLEAAEAAHRANAGGRS